VTVECADCSSYMCRTGTAEATPDNCPMHGEYPPFAELYATDESKRFAYEAALVESAGYCRWTRLREIAEFAKRMGYTKLGIAHCPETAREAGRVGSLLANGGLETMLPPLSDRCSPIEQARWLENHGSQFNVIAGMCVGHDSLLVRHSRVPVTSLIVRDLRLRHNPAAALYTSRSYLKNALYDSGRRTQARPFQGWSTEALTDAAERVKAKAGSGWCRIEEVMEYARQLGATRLGITFCVGFRHEARTLAEILRANQFQVSSACCKTGSVPKEALGISEEQKVRPDHAEMICNSLAQAELLNRDGVELVLLLGQCVGHDSHTMQHLEAPVVCVVAKDRVLGHNTVAALY
jgi:uncharacterized metal-binding protein